MSITIFDHENMWVDKDQQTGIFYIKVSDYYETGVCMITEELLQQMLDALKKAKLDEESKEE